MPKYTDRIEVAVAPEVVFRFVSDIKNLPKYLPTVHEAHSQPHERVEVDGTANGHAYKSAGWFKVDPSERTMTWGSDGENDYSGKIGGVGRWQLVCCRMLAAVHADRRCERVDGAKPRRSECSHDGWTTRLAGQHQRDL